MSCAIQGREIHLFLFIIFKELHAAHLDIFALEHAEHFSGVKQACVRVLRAEQKQRDTGGAPLAVFAPYSFALHAHTISHCRHWRDIRTGVGGRVDRKKTLRCAAEQRFSAAMSWSSSGWSRAALDNARQRRGSRGTLILGRAHSQVAVY
jgi:hypothetical protein